MLHLGTLRTPLGQSSAPTPPAWPQRFAELAGAARDPRLRAFYQQGVPPSDTPLSALPMVALDVETTGLDPRTDEIVSVGVVPMSLACIRASASRHWIVRPRGALSAESVTIHAITHAQVATAPDLGEILGEVLEAIGGRVVVVHCRAIERSFLNAALQERIGEGIEFPVIDTMELEARLHRTAKPGLLARLFGRTPAKVSIRLADSRARYHLPRYRAHHALTDALATAELLQAQVAHRFAPGAPASELWS